MKTQEQIIEFNKIIELETRERILELLIQYHGGEFYSTRNKMEDTKNEIINILGQRDNLEIMDMNKLKLEAKEIFNKDKEGISMKVLMKGHDLSIKDIIDMSI